MIMICNVPDEVIKSVRMGTWCGSSVAEKMIANGIPLDKIRAEIEDLADSDAYGDYQQGFNFGLMRAAQIIDKHKGESEE